MPLGQTLNAIGVGTALTLGGITIARLGWAGVRAGPPAEGQPPVPLWRRGLSVVMLLFGLFVLGCGLLMYLSVVLPTPTT